MISPSEKFDDSYSLCSLCARCKVENNSTLGWSCNDENSTPFIRDETFYEGKCLCKTGHNADCVYKYAGYRVIAIETKSRPLCHIKEDEKEGYPNLVAKIENCYRCACNNKLTLVAFILQLSSIKNSSKGQFQLLEECKMGLYANNLRIGKDGNLVSKKKDLKNMKVKFDIVKCRKLNDKYFNKLLASHTPC